MNDERIVAYLLGELPEEESERFEEECFAGEDWQEEVRAAEHDLVDAYLRGDLTPEQHLHFERNYLTTEKRLKRVATAAALLHHVDAVVVEKSSARKHAGPTWIRSLIAVWHGQSWAMRAGLAVVVAAVVFGAVWFARSRPSRPRTFATLTLTIADSNRAEGARAGRIRLPAGADRLRIYLRLPGAAAGAVRHRVELESEEGEKSPVDVAGRDRESVTVEIPTAQLKRGNYALRLFTVRPNGAEQRVGGLYYLIIE
jgi:hypothetical protein